MLLQRLSLLNIGRMDEGPVALRLVLELSAPLTQ